MTKARDLSQVPNASLGFKNRIINGDMRIDQRNAGASVAAGNAYTLDRWVVRTDTGSGNTTQQSTTAPTGFKNSLIVTVGTGAVPASNGRNYVQQPIEGLNVADLGWGTASASTVTLSFWVRSSVTGTYGGALQNSAGDRSYPFTYTISSANTFEYKSITIAGDTTGTWLTTNGLGINMYIGLGVGSSLSGTAGAWAGADYRSATGATNFVATSGATFYITGVMLEKGSTATSFDYRPYGTEEMLCKRYYQTIADGLSNNTEAIASGMAYSSTDFYYTLRFFQEMRTAPTLTATGVVRYYKNSNSDTAAVNAFQNTTSRATRIYVVGSSGSGGDGSWLQLGGNSTDKITASAEL